MRGTHHFIIEVKQAFNETFKTEGGLELYGDKRFLGAKLTNRLAKVITTPLLKDSVVKEGYEVMIDPTIFFSQSYEKTGKQDNQYILDREKGHYKLEPGMIVLYRENAESRWKGFQENILVEFIKEELEGVHKTSLILTDLLEPEYKVGIAKITFANEELLEMGVVEGDYVSIKKGLGVSFFIDGREFFWLRTRDVQAIFNKS